MAKEIDKIIQSKTAPKSNNVLWDDGENLKINRNGKWENSNGGASSFLTLNGSPISLTRPSEVITIKEDYKGGDFIYKNTIPKGYSDILLYYSNASGTSEYGTQYYNIEGVYDNKTDFPIYDKALGYMYYTSASKADCVEYSIRFPYSMEAHINMGIIYHNGINSSIEFFEPDIKQAKKCKLYLDFYSGGVNLANIEEMGEFESSIPCLLYENQESDEPVFSVAEICNFKITAIKEGLIHIFKMDYDGLISLESIVDISKLAQSGDPNDAMPIYLNFDDLQTGKEIVAEVLYRIQYMSQALPIPKGKGPAFIYFYGTIMATRYNYELENGKRRLKLSYIIPNYSVDEDGEEYRGCASNVYAVDYSVDENNYPIPTSVTVERLANLSFDIPNQE